MSVLECIALSLSVPRPQVTEADVVCLIKQPDIEKFGLADAFFTEIARTRIAEAVQERQFSWDDLINAANVYGLGNTRTAKWCCEMRR